MPDKNLAANGGQVGKGIRGDARFRLFLLLLLLFRLFLFFMRHMMAHRAAGSSTRDAVVGNMTGDAADRRAL